MAITFASSILSLLYPKVLTKRNLEVLYEPWLASPYGGPETIALVVRGYTGIFYRSYDASSGTWSGWIALGGMTPDAPSAEVCNGRLYVAVRGTNGDQIWVNSVDLSTSEQSGWEPLDGNTPSAPAMARG
ncbi:MAG: hypothetical protein ACQXXL_01730 [Candidatus Methanosuratincola sp.]|jgi:hypothetical protein|nr:hypothetical protein [Candidatus Methanosuratincola sp.]